MIKMGFSQYKRVKSALTDDEVNKLLSKGYEIYKVAQIRVKHPESEVTQMQHWLGLPK